MSDFRLTRQRRSQQICKSTEDYRHTQPSDRNRPRNLIKKLLLNPKTRLQLHSFQPNRKNRKISNIKTDYFDYRQNALDDIIERKYGIMKIKDEQYSHTSLISQTQPTQNTNIDKEEEESEYKETSTHNLKNFINKYFKRKTRRELRDRYVSLVLNEEVNFNHQKANKLFKLPPIMISSFEY